jgi:hypothetical protein
MPGQSNPTPVFSAADIRAVLAGTPNLYEPPNGGAPMRLTYVRTPLALPAPADAAETVDVEPAADHSRPWLTLAAAAEFSGLPESYLLWAAGEGQFPALDVGIRPGGRWRFHRDSLLLNPIESQ